RAALAALRDGESLSGDGQGTAALRGGIVGRHSEIDRAIAAPARAAIERDEIGVARGRPVAALPGADACAARAASGVEALTGWRDGVGALLRAAGCHRGRHSEVGCAWAKVDG